MLSMLMTPRKLIHHLPEGSLIPESLNPHPNLWKSEFLDKWVDASKPMLQYNMGDNNITTSVSVLTAIFQVNLG